MRGRENGPADRSRKIAGAREARMSDRMPPMSTMSDRARLILTGIVLVLGLLLAA